MSCGNPHETPCTEVLDRVYGYLDGELDDADCAKIRQHLDECGPCLREYGLDEVVKRVVHKRWAVTWLPRSCARRFSSASGKSARLSSSLSNGPRHLAFQICQDCGNCATCAVLDCSL